MVNYRRNQPTSLWTPLSAARNLPGSFAPRGIVLAITAAQLDVRIRTEGADKAQRELRGMGDAVDNIGKRSSLLGQALGTGLGFIAANAFTAATGAVVGFSRSILDAGMGFEAQMSAIEAVSGATAEQMDLLSDKALDIGKNTQFSAGEAAGALEELLKAGLSVDDVLNGAADSTALLAAAGGVDMPQAAAVMTAAMNQFGIAAADSGKVADLLAAASAKSATGVLELGESLKYVGTQAHAMGYDIETITTALAIMADQGIVGSQAGTSLNQALLSLANPTAAARTAMDQLGISFTDVNGNMLPLPNILAQLNTALAGYGDAQRAAFLETLFGVEGGRAMNALLTTQTDAAIAAGKGWDSYYDAVTQTGVASEQAAARMDNTMGSLEQLKGSLETLAIIVSMAILPAFRGAIDGATGFVNGLVALTSELMNFLSVGDRPFESVMVAINNALYRAFGRKTATAMMGSIRGIANGVLAMIAVFRQLGSLVRGAFGKAFDVLIGHIDAVLAGLKGIAVVAGLFLGWGAITAIVAGLGAALGLLLSPLLLIAGAAAALGIAWESNFLGMRDALSGVFDNLDTFGNFLRAITLYGNDFNDWLRYFPTWMQPVIAGIGTAVEEFRRLRDILSTEGIGAALDAFMADMGSLSVSLVDWTLNVGIPALASLSWDLAGLILPYLTGTIVSLTDWIASLDGAKVVLGTLNLANEIGSWILANPIGTVAISAAVLSLLFFGAPGLVAVSFIGFGTLLMLAITKEVPKNMIIPLIGVSIALVGFIIEVGNLTDEILLTLEIQLLVAAYAINQRLYNFGHQVWTLTMAVPQIDWPGIDLPDTLPIVGDIENVIESIKTGVKVIKWVLNPSMPDIDWPDAPGLGDVPFFSDVISLLVTISNAISVAKWTIKVGMPDINWPDPPSLDSVPDWVKDPVGWVQDQLTGSDQKSGPKAIPQQGGGGGGYGEELPYGNSIALPAVDTTAFVASLESAKAIYNDFVASVAGGGGARGAAGGAAGPSGFAIPALDTSAFTASLQTAQAAATAGMAAIRAAITSGMAAATGAVVAGVATMAGSMVAGMATFRGAVTSGMASAVGAVRAGIAAMVAAASAGRGMMMSAGLGIGAALGQGIAAGIRGQIGAVAAAAAALVTSAVAAARNAGAIHSPSEVMRSQVGLMLGAGVEAGILDSLPGIQRAADQMVPSLSGAPGGVRAGLNGGGVTYVVNVTVEGNVTTENDLTASIARAVGLGIVNEHRRHTTAVLGAPV